MKVIRTAVLAAAAALAMIVAALVVPPAQAPRRRRCSPAAAPSCAIRTACGKRPDHPLQPGLRGGGRAERHHAAVQLVRRAALRRRRAGPAASSRTASSAAAATGGPYDFTAYNAARADWPMTHLTSGATIQIRYSNWAAHPGTFQVYITKHGWNPTTPLAWGDLEPFGSVTNPPQSGGAGALNYYYWNLQLPVRQTGTHMIFIQWIRSDSQENFFSCSDVVFDGGNGEVTGVGPGGSTPDPDPDPDRDPDADGRLRRHLPRDRQQLARPLPGRGDRAQHRDGHAERLDRPLGLHRWPGLRGIPLERHADRATTLGGGQERGAQRATGAERLHHVRLQRHGCRAQPRAGSDLHQPVGHRHA